MLIKYILTILCLCSFAFGDWFVNQWETHNPPTLEQSLRALLKVDCKKVELLKGIMPKAQYKGKQAQEQCAIEQRFLKAIINDDTQTYRLMRDNETLSKYFLFYTTQSPRIEITPLMVAIVFDSSQVFQLILADSGQEKRFSLKKPFYNINRVMSDDHRALGAFKLGNIIYNAHGVNALDLAAMYHRYDMFWALLHKGANYNDLKYPLTNGIITFGDKTILELMLHFDKNFLYDFGGGNILHFAARDGNVEIIEYLIKDKNMPIDALKAGETPLDAALNAKNFQHKPQLQAAQKLIELGAKVSEANAKRLNKLTSEQNNEEK